MSTTITKSSLKRGKNSFDAWVESLRLGVTPTERRETEVIEVAPDDVIAVLVSGSQFFGSGGYGGSSIYAGEEPEWIENLPAVRDGFTCQECARFRLKAGTVVHQFESDSVGEGERRRWNKTYICR